jgi:hypothetical protein
MKSDSRQKMPPLLSASTLGPAAVRTITLDERLLLRTRRVVIGEGRSGLEMRIIRESSTSPSEMSCEVYLRNGDEWGSVRKIRGPKLPAGVYAPPPGAMYEDFDGVECFTMAPMTAEEKESLRRLIAPATL